MCQVQLQFQLFHNKLNNAKFREFDYKQKITAYCLIKSSHLELVYSDFCIFTGFHVTLEVLKYECIKYITHVCLDLLNCIKINAFSAKICLEKLINHMGQSCKSGGGYRIIVMFLEVRKQYKNVFGEQYIVRLETPTVVLPIH